MYMNQWWHFEWSDDQTENFNTAQSRSLQHCSIFQIIMFKSAKWRKEKIKAVFGMQFQATQVCKQEEKNTSSLFPFSAKKCWEICNLDIWWTCSFSSLAFHWFQVPQLKAKSLMISLVSADTRRTSVKMGRAKIVEGTCSWDSPVCETIKLERDPKTGRIQEKIYYFVVATVSNNETQSYSHDSAYLYGKMMH